MGVISLVLCTILGMVLYRLGGTKYGTRWRDAGMPIIMLIYMLVNHHWHWTLILCMGLMYGAQTTYNKWAHKFFLKDDSNDVKWIDWLFTGLAFSFALLPYSISEHAYLGFIYRTISVTLFTVIWSEAIGKAWLEESGRGFIQIITLPLLT